METLFPPTTSCRRCKLISKDHTFRGIAVITVSRSERDRSGNKKMGIPILRASIPHHSHRPFTVPPVGRISRNTKPLFCAPPEIDHNPTRPVLSVSVGTHLIPHPKKVDRGGEDAFYVSGQSAGVFAIADGVSGWAEKNVDPALFARELMSNVSNLISGEEVNKDPQILMGKAHATTTSIGSATVILAVLDENGLLKIANVGDCGLRIIREGRLLFSTTPQEHYFDCPYQLSSGEITQTCRDASVSSVEVMEGDTIVMGSDGLFDNVFDDEIVTTTAIYNDVAQAAKALANLASTHSLDSSFDSPYILEARSKGFDVPWWKKAIGKKLTGGKLDDITVIVGQVVSS